MIGVSVKAGLWTGPWTGLWTGLGLDFVLVLPPIAAYSSEMLVPSRKFTASHRCGIEEAAKLEAMTSIHNFILHVIEFWVYAYAAVVMVSRSRITCSARYEFL